MFEKEEITRELNARLLAAGIDPDDPQVKAISMIVSVFYAEKTREVLQMMQNVLAKLQP